MGLVDPQIPNDPEILPLLARASGCTRVKPITFTRPFALGGHHLTFVNQLLSGQPVAPSYTQIHHDANEAP